MVIQEEWVTNRIGMIHKAWSEKVWLLTDAGLLIHSTPYIESRIGEYL